MCVDSSSACEVAVGKVTRGKSQEALNPLDIATRGLGFCIPLLLGVWGFDSRNSDSPGEGGDDSEQVKSPVAPLPAASCGQKLRS